MIDAKRYLRLYGKKSINNDELTKIITKKSDDGIEEQYLLFARFDVEYGNLIDPELQKINIKEIKLRQKEIQDELAGIDLLFKNIDI